MKQEQLEPAVGSLEFVLKVIEDAPARVEAEFNEVQVEDKTTGEVWNNIWMACFLNQLTTVELNLRQSSDIPERIGEHYAEAMRLLSALIEESQGLRQSVYREPKVIPSWEVRDELFKRLDQIGELLTEK